MELDPTHAPAPANELASLRAENERLINSLKACGRIIHNMTVANQSAWIEWKHGGGAEAAMEWIENGLDGPGLIPEEDEPHATDAQAYFDANKSYWAVGGSATAPSQPAFEGSVYD
jgi:hypothetical protein